MLLTVHSIPILLTMSATRASLLRQRVHQHLWRRRDFAQAYTGRVLDGVQDRRRGTVHGQLPDALRAAGAEGIRLLFEEYADGWNVGGGRHNVVRHLSVGHSAFVPNNLFIKSHTDSLRYATLDLSRSEDGMNYLAHLLHRNKIGDAGFERDRVHGDLCHVDSPRVRAVGVAAIGGIVPIQARWRFVLTPRAQRPARFYVTPARAHELILGAGLAKQAAFQERPLQPERGSLHQLADDH